MPKNVDGIATSPLAKVLAVWLASEFELGGRSRWYGYLQSLPTLKEFAEYHPALLALSRGVGRTGKFSLL